MTKQNITGPLREQSNWDQNDENRLGFIKNKPFYDTRKTAPLTIEWDGNTDGKEFFYHPQYEINYYKFSENVPTAEEIQQGEGVFCSSDAREDGLTEEFQFTFAENSRSWTDESGNIAYVVTLEQVSLVLIVVLNELIFPAGLFDNEAEIHLTKGMWSFCDNEPVEGNEFHAFTKRLYFPSVTTGELKTIDEKYLPDNRVIYYATPDSENNGSLYRTSEKVDKNMVTGEELKEAFENGKDIWVCIDFMGVSVYLCANSVAISHNTDTGVLEGMVGCTMLPVGNQVVQYLFTA